MSGTVNKRIQQRFEKLKSEGRKALVTYIMACDPGYDASLELLKGLPNAGADLVELGMPFSDPMADGPVIQEAATRALKAGCNTLKLFEMVAEFRKDDVETPIILMGYYNPIFHFGVEAFVDQAVGAGIDGMIIVDLPPEEEDEFTKFAIPEGLSLIKLTTPTTDKDRANVVLKNASGFVYYISVAGITGTKSAVTTDVKEAVEMLKSQTDLPVCVGFGIKTPEQAAEMADFSDGVVVGSAIVNAMKETGADAALKLVKGIKEAL